MDRRRGFGRFWSRALLGFVVAAGVVSCGTEPAVPAYDGPVFIRIVSGDRQVGVVGTILPEPVVFRVTDGNGVPLEGVPATFSVQGGGTFRPDSTQSSSDGTARGTWQLGPVAEAQYVTLLVPNGVTGASVIGTGVPGPAAVLTLLRGDEVSGRVTVDIHVRIADLYGNGVDGTPVTFTPGDRSGAVSPASSVTSGGGVAGATWSAGTAVGLQTVAVGSPGLQEVTARRTVSFEQRFDGVYEGTQAGTVSGGTACAGPLSITVLDGIVPQLGIGSPGTIAADGSVSFTSGMIAVTFYTGVFLLDAQGGASASGSMSGALYPTCTGTWSVQRI